MQVLDRTGVGTLWSICKVKFALAGHTHSWSQISGAPSTATRWPSWGEVTGKPELKNWSDTKAYIDSSLALSGGGIMIHTFNFTTQNKTIKLDESRDGIVLMIIDASDGIEDYCTLDASEFMARKAGNSLIFIKAISGINQVVVKTNEPGIQYTETFGSNHYNNGYGSVTSIELTKLHFGIVISKGGSDGSVAYYITGS